MCGIVAGVAMPWFPLEAGLDAIAHRGPDARGIFRDGDAALGHVRLSILDPRSRSDQPFRRKGVVLAYNGELWNYRELRRRLKAQGERFRTTGDTEVVAAALDSWGLAALGEFEGMFALAWMDETGAIRAARDYAGEIPLHDWPEAGAVASEAKAFLAMGARPDRIRMVPPGTVIRLGTTGHPATPYRVPRWVPTVRPSEVPTSPEEAAPVLRGLLRVAVRERAISDVPVATLLSGGVDSSAIARELAELVPGLRAYVATGSGPERDLRAAREVAERLGIELVEVPVPAPSASDLAGVVRSIEMPHKAQVEIAWACLALARRLREDGIRVVFSGEGSDELWGSYGFSYYGVRRLGWDAYRRELFLDQHRKNFARTNKVFMAHGVEARLPFLHRPLASWALSLPPSAVALPGRPKAILQESYRGDLPDRVVDRKKEAFQEGVGIREMAAAAVAAPARFYRAEYARTYGRMRP